MRLIEIKIISRVSTRKFHEEKIAQKERRKSVRISIHCKRKGYDVDVKEGITKQKQKSSARTAESEMCCAM